MLNRMNTRPCVAALALLLLLALQLAGCVTNPNATAERAAPPTGGTNSPLVTADNAPLKRDIDAVITALRANHEGEIYSGAVAGVKPDDLVIAVALIDGRRLASGDVNVQFPLMSVSKPFTYALALEQRGVDSRPSG